MKKVLFPFENNRTCYKEAYVYAVKLTRNLGAELIILNAFEIEVDNTITRRKYEQLIKNNWIKAYQEIILFHDYYLKNHARIEDELKVKTDHRIINGDLVKEFKKILETERIDLVVLPASSETDSTRKSLRLMRRETLDTEQTSLLVTPGEITFQPINKILFACRLKRLKGLSKIMDDLLVLAGIYHSSIHFLHLSGHSRDTQVFNEDVMESVQKSSILKNRIVFSDISDRNLGNSISKYISDNEIRMVAVAKQQINFFGEVFSKGIIHEMSSNARIPFLILRDYERE